jgi:hypothetical protein
LWVTYSDDPENPVNVGAVWQDPPTVEHTFGEWYIIKEANCTENGIKQRYCTECGYTETKTITAFGHTEVIDAAVEPTCTEDGLTEGKHCSSCGKVFVAQKKIDALGHTFGDWIETQAPTCEVAGKEVRTCSACGIIENQNISALGHTFGDWIETQAPTCEVAGKEVRTCSVCGKTQSQIISALGHVFNGCNPCMVCGFLPYHNIKDGQCEVCGYIPVFENASVYDNDGDGVNESYLFTPILPEKFSAEGAVHVWAGDYIPELSSSYVSSAAFNDIRHWYCTEGTGEFFTIQVTVAEAGIYEMAIHMRLRDDKERGTKYTINEGTANEYTFETSFQFATKEDAYAARDNDYNMSSYMFGIQVELQKGDNYIKIEQSSKSPKCQHYRDFYFVKVDEGCSHEYTPSVADPYAESLEVVYTCSCGDSYTETVTPTAFTITADSRAMVGYTGEENENLVIPAVFENEGTWYRVTKIDSTAFAYCSNLASVTIPKTVTSIGSYAFAYCSGLQSVTIPEGVVKILGNTFERCSSLTEIIIPTSVTKISDGAFLACNALANVYYKGSSEQWDAITIGEENTVLANATIHFNYIVE